MANTPLYIQIYKNMLCAIKNGEYRENTPLPSERELCEKYYVSRSTIRQTNKFKDGDYICDDKEINNVLAYYKITRDDTESN